MLLCVGCLVVGCWLLVVCCVSFDYVLVFVFVFVFCLNRFGCFGCGSLFVACWLLYAGRLPFFVFFGVFVFFLLWRVVCRLLFVVDGCRLLLVLFRVCCSFVFPLSIGVVL